MRKRDELADPNSCLNRAGDNDWVFVLKEGDPAMASTIRYWIGERLRLGCNALEDAKIREAGAVAVRMEV